MKYITTETGDSSRWWRLALLEGWVNGLRGMAMGRKGESPVTIFSGDSAGDSSGGGDGDGTTDGSLTVVD